MNKPSKLGVTCEPDSTAFHLKRTPERETLRRDAIQLRRELGWSQRQIASHLGVTRAIVQRWLAANHAIACNGNHGGLAVTPTVLGVVTIADAIEGMNSQPHNSVHLIFADPPYKHRGEVRGWRLGPAALSRLLRVV